MDFSDFLRTVAVFTTIISTAYSVGIGLGIRSKKKRQRMGALLKLTQLLRPDLATRIRALIGDIDAEARQLEDDGRTWAARKKRSQAWLLAGWYVARGPYDRLADWLSGFRRRE